MKKTAPRRCGFKTYFFFFAEEAFFAGFNDFGGGSLPGAEMPSYALRIKAPGLRADELAKHLRLAATPIIPRVASDCVILDMIMPKMGGHNTFYQLKALDPKVKVILSSGYVSEQEVDDILKQGAKSFIPKPHRIKDIAIEIRRVLDEK